MFFVSIAGFSSLHAACNAPPPTILDGVLKTNVDKDGYLDYDAVRVNKGGDILQYITFLETVNIKTCSDNERLAFWINSYNAHAIRLALARPQLNDLSQDFKLFGEKFKLANNQLSLNEIEHRILRAAAKNGGPIEGLSMSEFDPRLHFALSFGAIGAPTPRKKAVTAPTLEPFLQEAAVAFVNSPRNIWIEDNTLYVSSLFRWYAEDFQKVGGAGAFITSLLDPKLRADAPQIIEKLKTDFPELTQFRFDWRLNSVKNKPVAPAAAPAK